MLYKVVKYRNALNEIGQIVIIYDQEWPSINQHLFFYLVSVVTK